LIVAQLHKRLGSLDKALEDRIDPLSAEQLQDLGEALLEFSLPTDLTHWFDANSPTA
jgi:hypothetical protein